jgi:hypothetical protein
VAKIKGNGEIGFDQRCSPVGACNGCLWWTFKCVLWEYGKDVNKGGKECRFREPLVRRVK